MNSALVDIIKDFLAKKITPEQFFDMYVDQWRIECKTNEVLKYNYKVSEALSSSFVSADRYNPSKERHESEIDEKTLRRHISRYYNVIQKHWNDPV